MLFHIARIKFSLFSDIKNSNQRTSHQYHCCHTTDPHCDLCNHRKTTVLHRCHRHDRQQPHVLSCDHGKHHSDSHHTCDPEYFPHGICRKYHFDAPEQDRCIKKIFIDIVTMIVGKCFHQYVDCKIGIKRDNSDFFYVSIF